MKHLFTPLFLLIFSLSFSQITTNSSTGRIIDIDTDFSFRLTDKQYDRPILQSGWLSGIGDYLSIKHGGGNTEENTFGLRISDGYGFDFGKNDFTTSFLKIRTNGNVGIGTSSPSTRLHISNGNSGGLTHDFADLTIEDDDNTMINLLSPNDKTAYYGFSDTDDNYVGGIQYVHATNSMMFRVNDHLNDMIIDQNGKVGIGGTTIPGAKLEVRSSNNLKIWLNRDDQSAISFVPNNGNSIFHIAHGLNNDLNISHGSNPGGGNIMTIKNIGYVGIGTTNPDSKLTVKGKIHAEEVKIDLSVPAPDYVFTKDYDLLTIEEVQQHITEKGHLPNIPSAKELEANGIELGIMNMKLLEKIEELTLYTIEQEKKIQELQIENERTKDGHPELVEGSVSELKSLKDKNEELEQRLKKLEAIILNNKS